MHIQYTINYQSYVEAQKALLGARLHFMRILGALFILVGVLEVIVSPGKYPGAIMIVVGGFFAFC
jgi:hypothetical protein